VKRSAFGLGIIACKQGKTLEDNPFSSEASENQQINQYEEWIDGWTTCENNAWGDMKKHGVYEVDIEGK